MEVLRAELKDHLDALERILEICDIVSRDRYRDEWQLCQLGGHVDEDGAPTTCGEWCDGFDQRSPHRVIADTIADLQPLSADLRSWIAFQAEYHAKREEAVFGPGGLFGNGPCLRAVEQGDGTVKLVPMREEEVAASHAQRRAREQAHHESVAARMDQYELNWSLIQRICEQEGSLADIVYIIQEGMPPLTPVSRALS
jgi:hypothetical protein